MVIPSDNAFPYKAKYMISMNKSQLETRAKKASFLDSKTRLVVGT